MTESYHMGVDIGGTFTDIVCLSNTGTIRTAKIPTTSQDPSIAVLNSISYAQNEWLVQPETIASFSHGTTIATNAVIQRKGARIGLLCTAGFSDVLEIGRQARTQMYRAIFEPETPVFLAPGRRRFDIQERVNAKGEVWESIDLDDVVHAVEELSKQGVDSIAVCFLFSFANPDHEIAARDKILELRPDIAVSLSSEVDPAFREYERTVVTAFDAYVKPGVDRYIERLERGLSSAGIRVPLRVMQSRGGLMTAKVARERPVRLFLSGPAAGVVGGGLAADAVDVPNIISIDVGGTSSDIALIYNRDPLLRNEGRIAGYPVRVSMLDVNAIGAGGGSIASVDEAGSLRIGPESAGSEPGPACYSRGGVHATVTDAALTLGYLNHMNFAGGVHLDQALAIKAIEERVALPLGISVEDAALGIFRVAIAQMAEGVRYVSVRQGFDPRKFSLLPLGGAGPLHACALAEELGITTIIVPPNPGVLSAVGLLAAPVEHEVNAAFSHPLDATVLNELRQEADSLNARCSELMLREGVSVEAIRCNYFADICYVGQSYAIAVPVKPYVEDCIDKAYEEFLLQHDSIYGHSTRAPAKFVGLKCVQSVENSENLSALNNYFRRGSSGSGSLAGMACSKRPVRFLAGAVADCPIYDRHSLPKEISGPAVIEQSDTTIVIEPGWNCKVHQTGNLVLTRIINNGTAS